MYVPIRNLSSVSSVLIWPKAGGSEERARHSLESLEQDLGRWIAKIGWPLYVVGMLVIVVLIFATMTPAGRNWLHRAHVWVKKKSGRAWVFVRLGVGVATALLVVKSKVLLVGEYPHMSEWIGEDLLAFTAIVFAMVQFLDAREGEQDLRTIEKAMETAVDRLSTRAIGPFPDNLDDVVELITGAKSSVQILVDFPGYGQYSQPELHQQYLEALSEAASRPNVKFQLISYDHALTETETKLELPEDLTNLQHKDKDRFVGYLKANGIDAKNVPRTRKALETLLRTQQNENLQTLESQIKHRDKLEHKYLCERVPLFLWLIDKREAVFTFKNLERNDQTYSIRTTDGWLVNNLGSYFEHTFVTASPSFTRQLAYKLVNLPNALADHAKVTIVGEVREADGEVVVESVSVK
jgi:hypothetical protein